MNSNYGPIRSFEAATFPAFSVSRCIIELAIRVQYSVASPSWVISLSRSMSGAYRMNSINFSREVSE